MVILMVAKKRFRLHAAHSRGSPETDHWSQLDDGSRPMTAAPGAAESEADPQWLVENGPNG